VGALLSEAGKPALDGTMDNDLWHVQSFLDGYGPDDTAGIEAIGMVFGDVLVTEFGLEWVSQDNGGRPILRKPGTESVLDPAGMVLQRKQRRDPLDLEALYESLSDELR
jgi:hypothetical protein